VVQSGAEYISHISTYNSGAVRYRFNRHFYRSGRAWLNWLGRAKVFWSFLFTTVTVCLSVDWVGHVLGLPIVDRYPYAGFLLEVLGVVMVARGFAGRLRLYGRASIRSRIATWFKSIPLFSKHSSIKGRVSVSLDANGVTATGEVGSPTLSTFDERLDALEALIRNYRRDLDSLAKRHDHDIAELRRNLEDAVASVRDDVDSVRELSADAHVGDVGMELAGLGWILIGLALATVPNLIHWIVSPLRAALTFS
jgi:hypothetical protein